MKTQMHQTTSLRQDLRMNPRLYQAMDLLYMPLQDLQLHLKEELLVNPFLELVEPEDEEQPQPEKLAEERKQEAEQENEMDWEQILLDGFQVNGARSQSYEDREFTERVTVDTRNLDDHLRDQLQMLDLTPRQRLLADEFLGNIGEDGYLQATLDEIVDGVNTVVQDYATKEAEEKEEIEEIEEIGGEQGVEEKVGSGVESAAPTAPTPVVGDAVPATEPEPPVSSTPAVDQPISSISSTSSISSSTPASAVPLYSLADAEEMLRIIQRLDPPGVGARNLRECLLLQLDEQGDKESLTYKLVDESFDDLIGHRWSELAKRYGLEPKDIQDAADQLSRLDPKPGLQFLSGDDGYVTPDLVVEKIDGKYRVFLNDSGTPRLRISKIYQQLAGDKKQFQGENREFVTEKLNSATWLIQAIEQRRQTMLKVMNFIVDRQRDFFEKGVEYLKPLTLREVADVISMHESTVSRVTNQKYVQTPRGVLPLKFFFSSSLGTTSGEDASARAVKAQIQKMVADENPGSPLTDSEIVDQLAGRGIRIARRTVAKYRDQLKILPARMRKRV